MSEASKYNIINPKFGGGFSGDGGTTIGGRLNDYSSNIDYSSKQNLAEAAAEIQQLLNQLAQTNPTTDAVIEAVHQKIKTDPTLKARLLAALKAGGLEALKAIFNNPAFSIPAETIKGFLEAE